EARTDGGARMSPKMKGSMRWIGLVGVPVVMLAAIALAPAVSSAPAARDSVAPAAPAAPVASAVSAAPAAGPHPPPPPPPPRARNRNRDDDEESRGAWLGVVLSGEDGTRVGSVAEDSPAEEAGLRKGDRILAIDGKEVEDSHEILHMMHGLN